MVPCNSQRDLSEYGFSMSSSVDIAFPPEEVIISFLSYFLLLGSVNTLVYLGIALVMYINAIRTPKAMPPTTSAGWCCKNIHLFKSNSQSSFNFQLCQKKHHYNYLISKT